MHKRIVSLYELEELLAGTSHRPAARPARSAPRRTTQPPSPPRLPATPGAATPASPRAYTVLVRSFDTGAPLRCEHSVSYTPLARLEVPNVSVPTAPAAPLQLGSGYRVEMFEDADDGAGSPEESTLRVEDPGQEDRPTTQEDDETAARRSADGTTVAVAQLYQTQKPATFARQMNAVERDLAELAGRVQTPTSATSESLGATPDTETEASPTPPAPPKDRPKGHAIFDEIAQGMSYATEFRLPPVQLSQVFSALDRQLDVDAGQKNGKATDPVTPPPVAKESLAAMPAVPSTDVLLKDLVALTPPKDAAPAASVSLEPVVADASGSAEVRAAAAIDIRHEVQLVPQQTGYSCWAAGAAMLVGWRDHMSVDPSEIARATGYWAQYAAGLHPEDAHMFRVWRLTPEPAQTYTVPGFADLLRRYGPLWVASAEPGPHIRVVTGMVGDGTPMGTLVYLNDPWEQGMTTFRLPNRGARYTETYQRFVDKQGELGRREIALQGIYVAHCEPGR